MAKKIIKLGRVQLMLNMTILWLVIGGSVACAVMFYLMAFLGWR